MTAKFLDCEQLEVDEVRAKCDQATLNLWFDQSEVKSRFKKSAMKAQGLRCCYCQIYQHTSNNLQWDLEHVLCEDNYPQFFAVDGNLAVACKRCNIEKGNKEVLIPALALGIGLVLLPSESEAYEIPHPALDSWDDCLYHVNFQIYVGKNEKGEKLLDICKLNKPAVDEAGLSYESVVAAARDNVFDFMGADVPLVLTDEQVVAKMRKFCDGQDDQKRDMLMGPLERKLAETERKARRRLPKNAVAAAKLLMATKKKKSAPKKNKVAKKSSRKKAPLAHLPGELLRVSVCSVSATQAGLLMIEADVAVLDDEKSV